MIRARANNEPSKQSIGTAEIWDPATGLWTLAGRMRQARARHTAAFLPNGRVLVADGTVVVAGGVDRSSEGLGSTELFSASP
jgi:hypothetical protein